MYIVLVQNKLVLILVSECNFCFTNSDVTVFIEAKMFQIHFILGKLILFLLIVVSAINQHFFILAFIKLP